MEDGQVLPQARQSAEDAPPEHDTDDLDNRMFLAPPREHAALLVGYLAPQTSSDSPDWILELAARAGRYDFSVPQLRRAATDMAWMARMSGQRYPDDHEWDLARSPTDRLTLAYVHGQRLRFDFKFSQLHAHSKKWLAEFTGDALILALACFAALGLRESNGLDLFERALDSPNADEKSRHVCLGAMEFADHLADQGNILLRLSDDMMARGEDDENVRYRRATALRKLGRFDEALAEIDRAIDGLDAAGRMLVHEQYSQERRAIIEAQAVRLRVETMARQVAENISAQLEVQITAASVALEEKIATASSTLGERIDTAQGMVSDGLLKMVEILGLFVTLLGFVVGSGAVVLKARSFPERAAAMGLVVVGSLVFFGLLRLVVGIRRKD